MYSKETWLKKFINIKVDYEKKIEKYIVENQELSLKIIEKDKEIKL